MNLPETSSNSCSQPPWYDEKWHAVKKEEFQVPRYICKNKEKDSFSKCLGHLETDLSI